MTDTEYYIRHGKTISNARTFARLEPGSPLDDLYIADLQTITGGG